MTVSRTITRITLLLIAAGLVAGGARVPERMPESRTAVERRPRFAFDDVTAQAGMAGSTRTWGSTWTDYDGDGRPDLWIGRHWKQPLLMKGLGGNSFTRVMDQPLRADGVDRHACAWGEASGDGKPDLYCVRGADKGIGKGANQLFVQTASGFQDLAEGRGVSNPRGRGRSANWFDYDSDGDLDIFVGNLSRAGFPNALFRNDGKLFTQVEAGLSHELATVSSSWADWDLDGDPDLLVLQHGGRRAVAYENSGGYFTAVSIPHVTDGGWTSAAWGEIDGDGRPDLHLVSENSSVVLRNVRSGFRPVHSTSLEHGRMSVWLDVDNDSDLDAFVVQGARGRRHHPDEINHPDFLLLNLGRGFKKVSGPSFSGPTRGNADAVSAADYDRDGRVDLFITNGLYYWRGPNVLLRNASRAGGWMGLDLTGPALNPMGYGADVRVRIGNRKFHRQITDEANYRTQNEVGYLHLGIGAAKTVSIEVAWPDGSSDCIRGITGVIVELRHGTLPCPAVRRTGRA